MPRAPPRLLPSNPCRPVDLQIIRLAAVFSDWIYDFISNPRRGAPFEGTQILEYFADHQNGNIPYVITRRGDLKTIFVVFRGTYDLRDLLSDATGWTTNTRIGWLHKGLAQIVDSFYRVAERAILGYAEEYPGHSFVFTGHSLGGGVAAAAAGWFRHSWPGLKIRAVVFGAMSGFDWQSRMRSREYCATFIMKNDIVPFLALAKLNPLPRCLPFVNREFSMFRELFPPGEHWLIDEKVPGDSRTLSMRLIQACCYFEQLHAALSTGQHSSRRYSDYLQMIVDSSLQKKGPS
jgi:hypothetical protein